MYKMLVLDLDNTLMHTDKSVSEFSNKVLSKAHEEGYVLMLATARVIGSIQLEFPFHAATCLNGSLTYVGNELIDAAGLTIEQTKQMVDYLLTIYPESIFSLIVNDVIYDSKPFSTKNYREYKILDPQHLPEQVVNKINIVMNTVDVDDVIANTPNGLVTTREAYGIAVVWNNRINKMDAIDIVSRIFGVERSEIVAFGDAANDMKMLMDCGLGVAVGNASEEVKRIADVVVSTNEEDGVATFINDNLLSERIQSES